MMGKMTKTQEKAGWASLVWTVLVAWWTFSRIHDFVFGVLVFAFIWFIGITFISTFAGVKKIQDNLMKEGEKT